MSDHAPKTEKGKVCMIRAYILPEEKIREILPNYSAEHILLFTVFQTITESDFEDRKQQVKFVPAFCVWYSQPYEGKVI